MGKTVEKTVLNVALAGYDFKAIVSTMREAKTERALFGIMYGNAYDTAKRGDVATGETRVGFTGQFEFVPTDSALDTFASDLLFLPKPLHDKIFVPLDTALYPPSVNKEGATVANDRKRKAKASIVFAYSATLALTDTDAGYKWEFNFLVEPAASDPFAALKEKAAAQTRAQPAKQEAPKAKEEPAPARRVAGR